MKRYSSRVIMRLQDFTCITPVVKKASVTGKQLRCDFDQFKSKTNQEDQIKLLFCLPN